MRILPLCLLLISPHDSTSCFLSTTCQIRTTFHHGGQKALLAATHEESQQQQSSADEKEELEIAAQAQAAWERYGNQYSNLISQQKQRRRTKKLVPPPPLKKQNSAVAWEELYPLEYQSLYSQYSVQSANSLKERLKDIGWKKTGRKPDLVQRLIHHEMKLKHPDAINSIEDDLLPPPLIPSSSSDSSSSPPLSSFGSLTSLPPPISQSLSTAGFLTPTPIQSTVIPLIQSKKNVIMHAETGSGKTLAYLLPLLSSPSTSGGILILTPTRELATQVASIARSLCGEDDGVMLVTQAENLGRVRGRELEGGGGRVERGGKMRVVVGSAKVMAASLFGEEEGGVPATPKPLAKAFMMAIDHLVLDEVDRLLAIAPSSKRPSQSRRHEKPAAILISTITRLTLSRTQIIAASATVGRPLRRELSRVLGLTTSDPASPIVVRPPNKSIEDDAGATRRAITVPDTVKHYVLSCPDNAEGRLLTTAAHALQKMNRQRPNQRTLLVLTKSCDLSVTHVVGAFRHFGVNPEPKGLLDAIESDEVEMDRWMTNYERMSHSTGVGQQRSAKTDKGYFLIAGEDSVRGLHLSDLDVVIVVGRTKGPDEYMHVAGRTGRAGKKGCVLNLMGKRELEKLKGWETMLRLHFQHLDIHEKTDLWD